MSGRRLAWKLLGLAAAAALPVAASALRGEGPPRCARDGVALGSVFRARIVAGEGAGVSFCSVRCVSDWLRRTDPSTTVEVTDESRGTAVDAASAWFVRSRVVTSRATGERIHAFARREDAEAHAAAHGGVLLEGDEHPFRTLRGAK